LAASDLNRSEVVQTATMQRLRVVC